MNMVKLWLLLRLSITGSILIGTLGVEYRCSNEAKTWTEAVHDCGVLDIMGEILHVSVTNNKTLTPNGFENLTVKTLNVREDEEVWFGNYITIGGVYLPPPNTLTPISTNDHICGAVTLVLDENGGLKTSTPLYQHCDTKLQFLCGYTKIIFNHDEIKTWNDARQACGKDTLNTPGVGQIPVNSSADTSVLYWVNKVWTVKWHTYDRYFTDLSLVPSLCGIVVYNSTTPRLAYCNDKKRFVCSFQHDGVDAYDQSNFSKSCKFEAHEKTSQSLVTQTKDIQGPTSSEQPQFSASNSLPNSTIADAVLTTMFSKNNAETAAETSHLAAYVGVGSGVFIIICIGLGILLFIKNRRRTPKKDKRSSNQYVDSNLTAGTGKTSGVQHINATYESDAFPLHSRTYDSSSPVVNHQVKVKELDQTSHYHSIEMNAEQELQPSIGGPTEASGTNNTYDNLGDAGSSPVTTEAARDSENVYNRLGGENQYGAARKYGEAMTYDHVTSADASMYDTTSVNPDTKPDSTYDHTY